MSKYRVDVRPIELPDYLIDDIGENDLDVRDVESNPWFVGIFFGLVISIVVCVVMGWI